MSRIGRYRAFICRRNVKTRTPLRQRTRRSDATPSTSARLVRNGTRLSRVRRADGRPQWSFEGRNRLVTETTTGRRSRLTLSRLPSREDARGKKKTAALVRANSRVKTHRGTSGQSRARTPRHGARFSVRDWTWGRRLCMLIPNFRCVPLKLHLLYLSIYHETIREEGKTRQRNQFSRDNECRDIYECHMFLGFLSNGWQTAFRKYHHKSEKEC